MKLSILKKKDLDLLSQMLNTPTFSMIDELQPARQAVQRETQRRIDEKIQTTKVIPILNKVYAVSAQHLGFVFRVVGGEKIDDVIIPIVKGFASNSSNHTICAIENVTICEPPLYRLYWSIQTERLMFEYETSSYEVLELNEHRYKDICSLMGVYIDEKIFEMRE